MTQVQGILLVGGLGAGLLAGLLGIGGGTVLVPLLVVLGRDYDEAVATSSFAIVITSLSGSVQNWRMGFLDYRRVLLLGLPAILTAQIGAPLLGQLPNFLKEAAFGLLLLGTIYLTTLRQRLVQRQGPGGAMLPPGRGAIAPAAQDSAEVRADTGLGNRLGRRAGAWREAQLPARLGTGAVAGLLAGLFGVGGGVVLVPLQMLLLGEPIKRAIQTSLGVIVLTSISAASGHALQGNVRWLDGLLLDLGGLVGAQISTRFLPKLPDWVVSLSFRLLLALLAIYFWLRAVQSYPA